MKVIGLTGGIGAGKSTAAAYMAEKGCIILDADAVSRETTAPGAPALTAVRAAFGDEYFFPDGSLDRKKTAAAVFGDAEKKRLLEDIVTADVKRRLAEEVAALRAAGADIAVVDAPLLFECGAYEDYDENWLVTAGVDTRVARVGARDGLAPAEVFARIEAQMPEEEKKKLADVVIYNDGDLHKLYGQIDELLERLRNEDKKR